MQQWAFKSMALEVKNTALGPGLSRDQKLMDGFPSSFVGNGWEWRQEARLNIFSPKCERMFVSLFVCVFVCSFVRSFVRFFSECPSPLADVANVQTTSVDMWDTEKSWCYIKKWMVQQTSADSKAKTLNQCGKHPCTRCFLTIWELLHITEQW